MSNLLWCYTHFKQFDDVYRYSFITVELLVSLLTIVLSSLFCNGLCKVRKGKFDRCSRLFVILSISDILMGVCMLPWGVMWMYLQKRICVSHSISLFFGTLDYMTSLFQYMSTASTILITVNRYLLIKHEWFYHRYFTRPVATVIYLFICGAAAER